MATKPTFSPAKGQTVVVICDRPEIEAMDISKQLAALNLLVANKEVAIKAEGCLTLLFHGYNDDPRPLVAVPEIRAWFLLLANAWPYWSFFANRTDETIPIIISLLLAGKPASANAINQDGVMFEFNLKELASLMSWFFVRQNDLIERLLIEESVNERSSNDFAEAVAAAYR